jgi:hypothetical protein
MNKTLLCIPWLLWLGFVLTPFVASATTKTEQVERYLGTHRYKRERPVGVVKFVFRRAVLKRQGDGKKTYEQLLIGEPGFSNRNNAGPLLRIQIVRNGETITVESEADRQARKKEAQAAAARAKEEQRKKHRSSSPPEATAKAAERPEKASSGSAARAGKGSSSAKPAEPSQVMPQRTFTAKGASSVPPAAPVEKRAELIPVAYTAPSAAAAAPLLIADPVRPRQNIPPPPGLENKGLSLPDSITVVRNIEEAKEQITTWKGRLWQTIKPAWEFVMWVFSSLIVILICFAGICRYVAKTAASESLISAYGRVIVGRWIVSAHQNAAAMLLVITWIIAIVLLLDVFMWLVYLNLPIWTLLIIWFPALWLAEKITSWIVPNIPIVGGP